MTDTFRPVAVVLSVRGASSSKAFGLTWRGVDLAAGTLTVSGNSAASAATVPLLPGLVHELREHRSRQAGRGHSTRPRGRAGVRHVAVGLSHAATRCVLSTLPVTLDSDGREPVSAHDLRHSFMALGLEAGAWLAEVAALARHANARVTAQLCAGLADDARGSGKIRGRRIRSVNGGAVNWPASRWVCRPVRAVEP
jgi:integrase